jgi:hypothetical protein
MPENRVRIEYMPLSELVPARRSRRQHDLGAIDLSIERFGYNALILWPTVKSVIAKYTSWMRSLARSGSAVRSARIDSQDWHQV